MRSKENNNRLYQLFFNNFALSQVDADTIADSEYIDVVEAYEIEFKNYIDGDQNYEKYHEQECEISARKHAAASVLDYYNKIKEYG